MQIRGNKDSYYKGGKLLQRYNSGSAAHIREFARAIQEKRSGVSSVASAVETTLTTILGRMAAEQRERVTWKELEASQLLLQHSLDQLS